MSTGSVWLYSSYLNEASTAAPICIKGVLNQSIRLGYNSWIKPDKTPRIKPVPLWKYPTSRGPFQTRQVRYMIIRTYPTWTCNSRTYRGIGRTALNAFTYSPPPVSSYPWSNILASKVKGLRCNLASDIAEYRDSLTAATTLAEKLTKAVRVTSGIVRKCGGNPRCIAKLLGREALREKKERFAWGDVPSAWLTGALALGPTVSSLDTVLTTLAASGRAKPILRVVRMSHTEESRDGKIFANGGYQIDGHYFCSVKTKVVAVLELTVPSGVWDDSFTPGNPLEVGYEMIPLSFVLDWFIPIGNWLSSLDAYSGVSQIWGSTSTRTRMVVTGVRDPKYPAYEQLGSDVYSTYQRTAFTQAPPLTIPHWSPHPTVAKLITAMSLLATSIIGASKP